MLNNNTNINNSTFTKTAKDQPFLYFIYVYYTVIFLFGLFGNILIITSVVKFKKLRTVFNTFLVNLAIADLLFLLLSIITVIKVIMKNEWIFGGVFCRIHAVFLESSFTVSMSTLAVVAFERYFAICRPIGSKKTIKQATYVCAIIWVFSIAVCSGLWYGSRLSVDVEGKKRCRNDNWSDNSRFIFYVIHTIVIYLVPLAVMCFSHIRITQELANQRKIKFSNLTDLPSSSSLANTLNDSNSALNKHDVLNQRAEILRKKRDTERDLKVIRLLVTTVVVFLIIWTPYIIGRLILYSGITVNEIIVRCLQVLILSSTAVNCIIYAAVNPSFRQAFKNLLCLFGNQPNEAISDKAYSLDSTNETSL